MHEKDNIINHVWLLGTFNHSSIYALTYFQFHWCSYLFMFIYFLRWEIAQICTSTLHFRVGNTVADIFVLTPCRPFIAEWMAFACARYDILTESRIRIEMNNQRINHSDQLLTSSSTPTSRISTFSASQGPNLWTGNHGCDGLEMGAWCCWCS